MFLRVLYFRYSDFFFNFENRKMLTIHVAHEPQLARKLQWSQLELV